MRPKAILCISLVVGILGILGLVGDTEAQGFSRQIKVGFSNATMGNPWRAEMVRRMKVEAERAGVQLIVTDAQGKAEKQISDMEDLVARGVNVLIVSTQWSDAVTPGVEAAGRAKIPVIVVLADIKAAPYDVYITTSNDDAGKACGEALLRMLGDKGTYVEIMGTAGSHAAAERSRGFHGVADQAPGWKMIAQRPADYRRDKALHIMEDILQANPREGSIRALYTHYDEMALGALEAIRAAKREGEIWVCSANAGNKEYFQAMMKEGSGVEVAVPYPFFANEAIETALKLARREAVPKKIVIPPIVVTRQTVKDHYDPNSPY